ncbi:MAG: type II toxin-antitoxin system prevent-host-death family antitoxin [Acidimicrobiia bacterium]|nr:type II toxin-antitoxin system prevent-host-death family antitoxin [Acidimicrobiia bacterium]MCY4433318.1 type II toxin-antitoxin system prevent-host-death family antitoxin [bacterium]
MSEGAVEDNICSDYSVPMSEFRANCARILNAVAADGREVVIERRGTPIAKIVPATHGRAGLRGLLTGLVEIPLGADIDAMKALDDDWLDGYLAKWDEELGYKTDPKDGSASSSEA